MPWRTRISIPRQKLLDRIGASAQAQLVLINAPAGYGKSTLLRQLAAEESEAGGKVGWITPMSQDADPSRLVQLFTGECERMLQEQGAPLPATRDLPGLLAAIEGTALFVLDEYDHFAAAGSDAFVARLIETMPAGVRVAIASRTMPEIAAARLKLSGRAVVLGSVDLRFDLSEAYQFFADRPGVGAEEVRRLHSRLDGWPAAFQFINLALQSPGCQASDALNRAMAHDMVEYLAREVFALQSTAVQRLLLDACLPDRISAPLLRHLTGDAQGNPQLDALWAAGLFLDPIDGDRTWYRFQPLFGDFLRARYRASSTEGEIATRHSLIADWFADNGMTEAAIDHYLAAGDQGRAADLLASIARQLVSQERLGLLVSLAERLEPEVFLARPALVAHAVIAYGFRRNFERAHQLLDWLQQHEPDVPPEVQAEREVQRCFVLAAEDHVDEMGARARDAAKWLDPAEPFFHGVALNAHAFWLAAQSQFSEAADLMLRARSLHEQAENYFGSSYAEAILGRH